MKVLIVSFYYTPELGAAPSRITNMAEGLKAKGADVEILTCLPNYPKGEIFDQYKGKFSCKEEINGISTYRYWTYATVSKKAIARILSMCSFGVTLWSFAFKRKKIVSYDWVVIQTPPILVAFSAILLFSCLFRKKTCLNVSDLWPESGVELGAVKKGSVIHKIMLWVEKFMYRHTTAYQGQSETIIEHIKNFVPNKKSFLYRNLQHAIDIPIKNEQPRKPLKIVYAGLLGVAQDMLSIIKNINFKELGAEFHLYGGGNQIAEIEEYISKNDTGVFYHGYLNKKEMVEELMKYNASIVPLTAQIKGAVPSKIFDLMPVGVPVLFCGSGEAAKIVEDYKIGYVSPPKDFMRLKENILKIVKADDNEYLCLRQNCISASKGDFSFTQQMDKYIQFLKGE